MLTALVDMSVWAVMLWLPRPLGRLCAAMTRLSAMDLHNTPPLEQLGTLAEIDAVSTAFYKLVGEVARQYAELKTVNDASPLELFHSDMDGQAVHISEACRRLFGATYEEALTDVWPARLHPDDYGAAMASWRDAFAREADYHTEQRVTVSGLGERLLITTVVPVRVDGEVVGHVRAMEDITI